MTVNTADNDSSHPNASGSLTDRVALVTGAGRGIGRGIALSLSRAGADVVVSSFSPETTEDTAAAVRDHQRRSLAIAGDITEPDNIVAAVEATIAEFGRIDVLVNNVGGGAKSYAESPAGPLAGAQTMWDTMYAQNLRAAVLMTEAVVPHMRKQRSGRIVNISSIAGRRAFSAAMQQRFVPPAYSAMKAAMISYTQSMAEALGGDSINVNAVCPGIVYTDAWGANAQAAVLRIEEYAGQDPRTWFEGIARGDYPETFDRTPLLREQTVDDVANSVVFLASDAAANITGQSLMVDGGMVMV